MFSFFFGKRVVEKRCLFFTNLCLSCVSKTCVSKKTLAGDFGIFQPGLRYRCKSQILNANIFIYIFEHKSKFATKKGIEKTLRQIVKFAFLSKSAYHSVCNSTI